jgi:dihydrofolate reductase
MRKIIVVTFMSMDGVLQAPGGPQEDPSGQFKWGGWTFHFQDEQTGDKMRQIMSRPFDLLLGRRTFEIFSAYWPYQGNHPIAEKFNSIRKYVVATTPVDISWQHSILIEGDVVSELKKLKEQDGPDLLVHGSSRLIQTLLANRLADELHTWIYPITFGKGKKLFQEGTQAVQWKLTDTTVSSTGVIMASYVPGGEIKTGSFVADDVSEAEMARREKLAREHSGK